MHRDVWLNMQNNWNDFYWLTGETPTSLQVLVDQLLHRNIFHNALGCRCALNYRNQVRLCHFYGVCICSIGNLFIFCYWDRRY